MEKIKTVEYYDSRWYKVLPKGVVDYYASATTKLGVVAKTFLSRWRGEVGNREADLRMFEAGQRGTRIHSAFEMLNNGGSVIYNPTQSPNFTPDEVEKMREENGPIEVVKYQDEFLDVKKLKEFIDIVKPKILAAECTVVSHEFRDAGTADAVYYIKGGKYPVNGRTPIEIPEGNYVVDLKSGKFVDKSAYRQTACYANAWNEGQTGTENVTGTLILHTGSSTRTGIVGFSTHVRTQEQMNQDFKEFRVIADLWEIENKEVKPKTFDFEPILKIGDK